MVENISNTSINGTVSTGHHHHVKQNFKMTDDQKKQLNVKDSGSSTTGLLVDQKA